MLGGVIISVRYKISGKYQLIFDLTESNPFIFGSDIFVLNDLDL